jgi:hypothetical protein
MAEPLRVEVNHKSSRRRIRLVTSSPNGRRGKVQLLARSQLDQRTRASKEFDLITSGIIADLGGEEVLTTVQRHLVEAFAGAAVTVNDLNARLLLGGKVDVVEHSQAIGILVRIAARLGLKRVAKDVSPSLGQLLQHGESVEQQQRVAKDAGRPPRQRE